ncbi:MAG: gluconate 2-dehydrogenase subunit 3 family protein [Rhodothermales bacterium]|nr:gluconate 2-dehydrogenase subunit 3 family protein [Rhodothermales bacterium]
MDRRDTLKLIAVTPIAAIAACSDADELQVAEARRKVNQAVNDGGLSTRELEFFSDHEYQTVKILADIIIPADDRSGAASDAHVAEFMDFIMVDQPQNQTRMRGGLAWIDHECWRRFSKKFADCSATQRIEVIEDIAWPENVAPQHQAGATFFSYFRSLTATGFWSSKIGVDDLQYTGNVGVGIWDGCPKECTDHIGVDYS